MMWVEAYKKTDTSTITLSATYTDTPRSTQSFSTLTITMTASSRLYPQRTPYSKNARFNDRYHELHISSAPNVYTVNQCQIYRDSVSEELSYRPSGGRDPSVAPLREVLIMLMDHSEVTVVADIVVFTVVHS